MNINNYDEFILESLILESNILYSVQFIDVLKNIEYNSISKIILGLMYSDIDVSFNYFVPNYKKNDIVDFYPDAKIKKTIVLNTYSFNINGDVFSKIMKSYLNTNKLDMSKYERLPSDVEIEIVEKIPSKIIEQIYGHIDEVVFIIKRKNSEKTALCLSKNLNFDIDTNNIKSSEMKIGRFINTILKKSNINVSNKEIEEFVNMWKSHMDSNNDKYNRFELVQGEDIRHWYYENNYEGNGGSLNGSCMKYQKCQDFFDIYVKNPEVCKLLVLKNSNGEKILGRALVWTLSDDRIFMDRIYTSNDSDVFLFKKYAKEKGWLFKKSQDFYEYTQIVMLDDSLEKLNLIVNLKQSDFRKYPYMDTLKYLNINKKTLTNDSRSYYDLELESTNGGVCEDCNGNGSVECDDCGGRGDFDCGECGGSGREECPSCQWW